jgi:F-box and leucine-rich repeat protein GRR1
MLLNLDGCDQITDTSIISISENCTGLQLLNLDDCDQITDISIIPISEKCTGLKELNVWETNITDASLKALVKNCTELQLIVTGYPSLPI